MKADLQIALISGPAYDSLYQRLKFFTDWTGITVNIAFRGDHPAMNRHLGDAPEISYDLVSTHSKYAPSQLDFLAPLDGLIDSKILEDFAPQVLELAKIDGALYGLPRNIDVRLLHYRTDIISSPPETWDELLEIAFKHNSPPDFYGFVFPGKESGLFGTFYELAEMGGAKLFPENLIPEIENEGGRWALNLLGNLYKKQSLPKSFTNWHFEEVHELFRTGKAAIIGDFPGYYQYYTDKKISKVVDCLGLCPYPVGLSGKSWAYGGSHTFGLTKKGVDNPQALKLLLFLTDIEQQLLEAENGCVPVRKSVLRELKNDADEVNRQRLEMLEKVIAEQILIPPKVDFYPKIENILWTTVQNSVIGKISADKALSQMTEQIRQVVEHEFVPRNAANSQTISAIQR